MNIRDKVKNVWTTQTYIKKENESEFHQLVFRNPVLAHCMSRAYVGDLTKEEALMSTIKFLILQNDNMFNALVAYVQRYGTLNENA